MRSNLQGISQKQLSQATYLLVFTHQESRFVGGYASPPQNLKGTPEGSGKLGFMGITSHTKKGKESPF
jgi:hypothetical protein